MARFSERIGVSSPRLAVQLNAMDAALQNALWNVLVERFLIGYQGAKQPATNPGRPYRKLWDEFFHYPTDVIPYFDVDARAYVRTWYFDNATWWQRYDLVQFAADSASDEVPSGRVQQVAGSLRVPGMAISQREAFCRACNEVLAREL
jgi:hypothetical protein